MPLLWLAQPSMYAACGIAVDTEDIRMMVRGTLTSHPVAVKMLRNHEQMKEKLKENIRSDTYTPDEGGPFQPFQIHDANISSMASIVGTHRMDRLREVPKICKLNCNELVD